MKKLFKIDVWAWFWGILALLYFFLPMYGTLDFSLRMQKGSLSYIHPG